MVVLLALPLLRLTILVTNRFERVSLRTFDPQVTLPGDLPHPYLATMRQQAVEHGFEIHGPFAYLTPERRIKVRGTIVLGMGPDRCAVAVMMYGKVAGLQTMRTILYTGFGSEEVIVSRDHMDAVDIHPQVDLAVLYNADFHELIAFHEQRVTDRAGEGLAYDPKEFPQQVLERMVQTIESLQALGYVKIDETVPATYRCTWKGAWRNVSLLQKVTKSVLKEQRNRRKLKRPGSAGYEPRLEETGVILAEEDDAEVEEIVEGVLDDPRP